MKVAGQYPLTLVTAYFELGGKSGFRENPYPGWIRNFLPYSRWPLVIFCDKQSLDMLREARGDKPAVWHVTRPQEFYVYKYLDDFKRIEFGAGTSLDLSLIWHEKHHFLRQAVSENPFASEMFFWCDIGLFRFRRNAPLLGLFLPRHVRLYEDVEWPDLGACRALPQDRVFFQMAPGNQSVSEKVFGGAAEAVCRWCDAYYQRLEWRARKGTLTPHEGFVMMSVYRRRPELAHALPYNLSFPERLRHLPIELMTGRNTYHAVWHLLKGGRFPWKYARRRFFPGLDKWRAPPPVK